ncbi:hypothetical protein BGW42_005282 [Actinomortierella wolfii]|nr:hypothetical protein BGW42_005282 [Actinomortierella wolfii]
MEAAKPLSKDQVSTIHEKGSSSSTFSVSSPDDNPDKLEKGLAISEKGAVSGEGSTPTPQDVDSPSTSSNPNHFDQSKKLEGKELALVIGGLMLVIFMASLDQTIVSVLIPSMGRVFNSPESIAWVGTSYLLTSTAFQPLYGKLSDIFGRRAVILTAIFFFLLGSLICGAAPTMEALLIGRGIAGLGAGGMINLVIIIVADIVSLRDRGKYQGIIGSMFGISSVIGPLLGGVLAEKSTWRWAFYINLPIGAVSTLAIAWVLRLPTVPGSRADKLKRIDFLGSLTFVAGVICILLSTNWGGNEYAWNSTQVIVTYCVGSVIILVFLWIEYKIAVEPILPFRLFKNRTVVATYLTSFFMGGAFMGALFYCPLYFQMVRGDSATTSGLKMIPMVVGLLLVSTVSGLTTTKTGIYRPFIWFFMLVFVAGTSLISTWGVDSPLWQQLFYPFVIGAGIGGVMQSTIVAGQSAVNHQDIAVVTSIMTFFRTMGGVIAVAIGGTLINNILIDKGVDPNDYRTIISHPQYYSDALQMVFRATIAWPAAAFISALFIQQYELRTTVGGSPQKTKDQKKQTDQADMA